MTRCVGTYLICDFPGCTEKIDLETNPRNPPADGITGEERAIRAGWGKYFKLPNKDFCPKHSGRNLG